MAVSQPETYKAVIVDDQLNMRKALVKTLEKTNKFLIEEFSSAKEAINWMKNHSFDVVISDIYMPNGNGYELLAYIRSRPIQSDVPVIFISGEGTKEDIVKCIDLGATDYVLKPFETQDILQKVLISVEKYKNPSELILQFRKGEDLFLQEKYKEAKSIFEDLINKDKASSRLLLSLAQTEAKLGNITKSLFYINLAIEQNKLYYPSYAAAADILIDNKKRLEAIPFLEEELKINGRQPVRRVILADLYLESGKSEYKQNASEQMRLALQDSPTDEGMLIKYSEFMKKSGNREKAIHYLLKARRQNTESVKSLFYLINMLSQEKKQNEAVAIMSDLIVKNPTQVDLYLCRAKAYENSQDFENAMSDLNKIQKTNLTLRLEVLKAKARVFQKMGKLPNSISASEEVLSIEPTSTNMGKLGHLYFMSKNYKTAIQWLEQSLQQDAKQTKVLYYLGCCFEALQQKNKAFEHFENARRTDPSNKEVLAAIARIKGSPSGSKAS